MSQTISLVLTLRDACVLATAINDLGAGGLSKDERRVLHYIEDCIREAQEAQDD